MDGPSAAAGKKRRRTSIAEIESQPAKLVTFTKRRNGLFRKAEQLCGLTRTRVGIIVFSPAGKPFTFGDTTLFDYFTTAPAVGIGEIADRMDKEISTCDSVDGLESLIREYEGIRDHLERSLLSESSAVDDDGVSAADETQFQLGEDSDLL